MHLFTLGCESEFMCMFEGEIQTPHFVSKGWNLHIQIMSLVHPTRLLSWDSWLIFILLKALWCMVPSLIILTVIWTIIYFSLSSNECLSMAHIKLEKNAEVDEISIFEAEFWKRCWKYKVKPFFFFFPPTNQRKYSQWMHNWSWSCKSVFKTCTAHR